MSDGHDLVAIERQMVHVLEACRAALQPLSRVLPSNVADDLLLKIQGRASVVMEAVKRAAAGEGYDVGPGHGFEQMHAGIEGWSEWRRPLPGYKIACCDCGLVHEMDFRIVRGCVDLPDGSTDASFVKDDSLSVIFRARRYELSEDTR